MYSTQLYLLLLGFLIKSCKIVSPLFTERFGLVFYIHNPPAMFLVCRRRRRSKGIHSRSDTSRTGAEGLSFYYPRLLHCLNQMLAVMSLSQHRVSSSKTVRSRAPCGARCIEHAVSSWSAVCSEAPHSQFGEGARPHLCMDEWNRPTPVRRRLSLTQAARGKPIPTGLAPVSGTKAAWKHFHSTPFSICDLSIQRRGCQALGLNCILIYLFYFSDF